MSLLAVVATALHLDDGASAEAVGAEAHATDDPPACGAARPARQQSGYALDDDRRVSAGRNGAACFRCAAIKAFVHRQRNWLVVERLPAYVPELNPVEGLWSNLKGGELANRCDDTIDATVAAATTGVERVRSNQQLLFAFLAKSGLSI
jgi:hypothetical protein